MQRKIGTEIELGKTVSPFDSIGASSAIDRTASNFLNSGEKIKKIRKLIETDTYDADIANYIPGTLEPVFQGMLEDVDTKDQPAHSLYRDMLNLDFQILLTDNYYTNPNSMHLYFPMKIKKLSDGNDNIDADLITINNFFAHFIKEMSVIKYGNEKQLIPTFSPYEIYQYFDSMLKHLPKDSLEKNLKKQCFVVNNQYTITKPRSIEGHITARR